MQVFIGVCMSQKRVYIQDGHEHTDKQRMFHCLNTLNGPWN